MPKNVQILLFKSLINYINYWDKEVVKTLSANDQYGDYIKELREYNANRFSKPEDYSPGGGPTNLKWYGFPVPKNNTEAMYRKEFMNMELYRNTYEQLEPFLAQLEKASIGVIPKEIIVPTELELGIFSFERAMMGMEGIPGLYSKKYDKYVSVEDGDPVLKKGKQTFTADKKAIYTYNKSNNKEIPLGTELWLQQLEKDGKKQYGSSNKKSFLKKEKYKRPANAIRLFVYVGGNWTQDTYWAGLTAVIAAQFLQTKGYSVKITVAIGIGSGSMNFQKPGESPELEAGARYSLVDVKDYAETMDSLTLLYTVSDPSFFRVRVFEYFVAQQWKNKDYLDKGLGHTESNKEFKEAFYGEVKKRNIEEEKDTLYYFLGGSDAQYSVDGSKRDLLRIICHAENTNKQILKELGYEFEPVENPDDYTVTIAGKEYDCIDLK